MAQSNSSAEPPLAIQKSKAPLRLIDISRTTATMDIGGGVCFIDPKTWTPDKRWDFHVLSHVWSPALETFSKLIGRRVLKEGIEYNHTFENAKLGGETCYQEFIKFLKLLRSDGVDYVWYDVLCINQTDEKEKGDEIRHMAAYYRYNKGCYVLAHGMGKGYKLWLQAEDSLKKESKQSIPRWFTRVWTFQEYVLPRSLIFVVEGLERSTKRQLNRYIRHFSKEADHPMLCSCIASWTFATSTWLEVDRKKAAEHYAASRRIDPHHVEEEEEEELLSTAPNDIRTCSKCGTVSLIRKVEREENLFFVDADAYFLLVEIDWGKRSSEQRDFFNTLLHLRQLATNTSRSGRIGLIFQELRKRECSREEDRVLGVLGLLEVGGDHQVRTKQTLEEQLMQLPPKLKSDVLVQLCVVDPETGPYKNMGLSWAPNLRPSARPRLSDIWRSPFWQFRKPEVTVVEPMACGRMRLRGRVVKARMIPSPDLAVTRHNYWPSACYFCREYSGIPCSSATLHQIRKCHLEVGNQAVRIPFDVHFFNVSQKRRVAGLVDVASGWYEPVYDEEEDEDDENVCWSEDARYEPVYDEERDKDDENVWCEGNFDLNMSDNLSIHSIAPFNLWLLHMGESLNHGGSPIVLVCLGNIGTEPQHELHKIGVLTLPPHIGKAAFSEISSEVECILGGFGKNHIQNLWELLAKLHDVTNKVRR